MLIEGLNGCQAWFKEVTWGEIREEVRQVAPRLAFIIDELSPNDSLTLFLAKYPFGAEILKKGLLQIPINHNTVVPITSRLISDKLKEKLGYNLFSNPVTLILKNSIELFVNIEEHTVPLSGYGTMKVGELFGIQRILTRKQSHHPTFIWDMTSGARSLFMLAPISEIAKHNRLRRSYRVFSEVPKKLSEHWQVFKEIANYKEFPEPWCSELLFFSKAWFENLEDKAWLPFKSYLTDMLWNRSGFARNNIFWELIFSVIQQKNNLTPSRFIDETARYLLSISAGTSVGFVPATHSELLPLRGLQSVYLNEYGLKEYHPTIMQPDFFSIFDENPTPLYYSQKYSIATRPLKLTEKVGLTVEMLQIINLLEYYKEELMANQFNIEGTSLFEAVSQAKFDFFHITPDIQSAIEESKNIILSDSRFLSPVSGTNYVGQFPAHSPFFKGCIRISKVT